MRLLYKDQLRKIKSNLFNFISLSLLVLIVTLTFTAVKTSVRRLEQNYETYLQEQQVEDFYFNMGEIDVNYLGGTAIRELCYRLEIANQCWTAFAFMDTDPTYLNNLNIILNDRISERPDLYYDIVDPLVEEFIEEYNYKVEKGHIVDIREDGTFYKFIARTETINIPYLVEGELPDEKYEVSLFPEYAELNNIEIGDSITIKDTEYNVVGFHYQPDYLFPIFSMNTVTFEPKTQTLVLCTEETMDELGQYKFTKYLVQGDISDVFGEEIGYEALQSGDFSALGRTMQFVNVLMPADINFRIITLEKEVANANAIIDIFLPLFISFVILLLVVFMKRYIDKNKKDIDTLHALGYTNQEITGSILLYPFLVSLSSIIGYLLGLLFSNQLFENYSSRYLYPKAGFSFELDIFLLTTLLPISIILIINYLFILRTLTKKVKTVYRFKIRLFKFQTLKTVLSTTILFFSISIMIIFGLNGNSMFTAFLEQTKLGNNYAEMVNLQYMTNTDHLDTYEEYTRMPTKIIEVNSRGLKNYETTIVYGINPDTSLKLLIDNDPSNNLLLEEGIIVSDYLKTTLNLKLGDTLTYEIGGVSKTETIVGFSNELIENNFFTTKENVNSFFFPNEDDINSYYNGLYATDHTFEDPFVTSRIDYANSLDEFIAVLNVSSIIINFLVILSVLLSLFIFGLILVNYFTDNRFNIAVLKSIGYNNFEINKKYLTGIYAILVLCYLISIPVTEYLLRYMLNLLIESVGFKLVLEMSALNIFIGFVMLNIIFACVAYFVTRYYDKINVSEIMKHQIN